MAVMIRLYGEWIEIMLCTCLRRSRGRQAASPQGGEGNFRSLRQPH